MKKSDGEQELREVEPQHQEKVGTMTNAESAYRIHSSNLDERNALIVNELPQVHYIAARIRERLPQHVEMEDLVHAGVIGLLEACRKFDGTKNASFSTFAKFRVRGAILDSLRQLDWGSRTLRKKGRAIASSTATLASTLGRQPMQEEIAADLKMGLEDLQGTMRELDGLFLVGQQAESSNDPSASYDLIESAPSRGGDNPFELCLEGEMKVQLEEAVARLSEREQLILSLYYDGELTMKEISEVMGVVVSRVSQIHSGALHKLRVSMQHLRRRSTMQPAGRDSRWQADSTSTGSHA
ncbi:MAG: FliA/WhiG family RNA polymerase sigma factor [Acidobacteriaceae bacterium]|nr:FliA/WhiG family RNA polymerase sigma factor [Acidobacteriaceae bacterium]